MRFTKEEFFTAMDTFKKMSEQEVEVAKVLGACEWCGVDWVSNYYELISDMCDINRDTNNAYDISDLDYYIWELEFGSKWKPGMITDADGNDIRLKTVEDLWNLLTED